MRRCLIALLTVLAVLHDRGAAKAEPAAPAFTETACALPNIPPELSSRLKCGTVGVPRDYANPGSGQFKLAVVVARSAQQPALPDPVVYISGGPGSPLTKYAVYQASHPYAPGRDLILVDQRGTGRSEPDLCPSLSEDLFNANFAAASDQTETMMQRRRMAIVACRDMATSRGIDLGNFGTTVTAEDFDWVRRALGITRWNVFGESYGTTVAMTLMTRHPDTIRSVILDSVYPPDPVLPFWSTTVSDARRAFLAACDRDTACKGAFPNLAGLYDQAVDRLRTQPLPVSLPPEMHFPGDRILLTTSLFEFAVGHLVYYPAFYPVLPRLIATVHDGDPSLFSSTLATALASVRDVKGSALYIAVECRDRPRYRSPLPADASVLDRASLFGICTDWSSLGPPPVVPAGATLPTLVLAGEFDPNARPPDSRHLADMIGDHAQWIEFAGIGHNVRAFSPCAAGIAAAFIGDPGRALETSCAGQAAPIHFLPAPKQRDPGISLRNGPSAGPLSVP